jgi:hypothetical protein
MSRLKARRRRQWARYVNHYAHGDHAPIIGGSSHVRVIWEGMLRQGPLTYKYIRRQAKR